MHRADRKRRSRLRVEGPLAPYFESYSEHLADRGYSQVAYWKKTFLCSEFSRWLAKAKIAAAEITADHEEAFLRYGAKHRRPKSGDRFALTGITCWLQENGIIASRPAASSETSELDRLLQEYRSHLREDRGLAPTTMENYAATVRRFLTTSRVSTAARLGSMRAVEIADHIRRIAPKDRSFKSAKNVVAALRSFFRFARYRDYTRIDLAAAVPSVAGWSMASIPRAMPADCVRRLLDESKTRRSPGGLRDRAVLLLFARLGLRAREVACLELDDIDWSAGSMGVQGKGRQTRRLPLPHDVGEAIATYLREGRPASACRRVFLRSHAPVNEMKTSGGICQIVRRAIRRTGMRLAVTGSHQLRHALAVDMLRHGASLTEIGQVLRHRSPDTTRQYAKVDIATLREVALPWPGELP